MVSIRTEFHNVKESLQLSPINNFWKMIMNKVIIVSCCAEQTDLARWCKTRSYTSRFDFRIMEAI